MAKTREELQDELMALLAAGRELAPDSDADLARVFLDRLAAESRQEGDDQHWRLSKRSASIAFIGVVWLTAAAILAAIPYYYYMHNSDVLAGYYSHTVPTVLMAAMVLSLTTWAANAIHWRLPRIRIIITPAQRDV